MTTMLLSTVALQTQNADDDFWARRLPAAYFTSINTLLAVPMPPPLLRSESELVIRTS
jgi:hypothetical protein